MRLSSLLASWVLLIMFIGVLYYSHPDKSKVDIDNDTFVHQEQQRIRKAKTKTDKSTKAKKRKKKNKNIFDHDLCNIEMFEGQWTYLKGCGDNAFNVKIKCEEGTSGKKKKQGMHCFYYEETDDPEYCPYEGLFTPKDSLSVDDGNCHLNLMIDLQTDDSCNSDLQYKTLTTRIIVELSEDNYVNKDEELKIYFSDDGEEYYNQARPRIAIPVKSDAIGRDNRKLHEMMHRNLCKSNTDTVCTIDEMNNIIDEHFGNIGPG